MEIYFEKKKKNNKEFIIYSDNNIYKLIIENKEQNYKFVLIKLKGQINNKIKNIISMKKIYIIKDYFPMMILVIY